MPDSGPWRRHWWQFWRKPEPQWRWRLLEWHGYVVQAKPLPPARWVQPGDEPVYDPEMFVRKRGYVHQWVKEAVDA